MLVGVGGLEREKEIKITWKWSGKARKERPATIRRDTRNPVGIAMGPSGKKAKYY